MAIKTQGTKVYIIDPEGTNQGDLLQISCVTTANLGGATRDQLDSTCLESPARTYEPGMPTPGQASLSLNFDPSVPSHLRIFELWKSGTKFDMAVGMSDGTEDPGIDTEGEFDLPSSRSFVVLNDVYFADCPLDFALNALVTAAVTVQKSGLPTLFPKNA
jgi:hypothetical protein